VELARLSRREPYYHDKREGQQKTFEGTRLQHVAFHAAGNAGWKAGRGRRRPGRIPLEARAPEARKPSELSIAPSTGM
jgi:hypothetical protein